MNPTDIHKHEQTPSTVSTEDDRVRRPSDASFSPLVAFCNFRVVKSPTSRRRSSATMDSTTASMSWHDSMESFTDGEDFLTGSPFHTNPFREEVNSVGSVRRTRNIPLNDPMMENHIPLPLALEPRSDSPECVESEFRLCFMNGSVRSECSGGVADASRKTKSTKDDPSKKNKRHMKRHGSNPGEPSSHSKCKEDYNGTSRSSRKKEKSHRSSRREHREGEAPARRSKRRSKSRSTRRRDLDHDVEKVVEKDVTEQILSLSLDDIRPKKETSSSKRVPHEKNSRSRRNQPPAVSSVEDGAAETHRRHVQDAHILAMQMLQTAHDSDPLLHYEIDLHSNFS